MQATKLKMSTESHNIFIEPKGMIPINLEVHRKGQQQCMNDQMLVFGVRNDPIKRTEYLNDNNIRSFIRN